MKTRLHFFASTRMRHRFVFYIIIIFIVIIILVWFIQEIFVCVCVRRRLFASARTFVNANLAINDIVNTLYRYAVCSVFVFAIYVKQKQQEKPASLRKYSQCDNKLSLIGFGTRRTCISVASLAMPEICQDLRQGPNENESRVSRVSHRRSRTRGVWKTKAMK